MADCKEMLRYLVEERGYGLPSIERVLELPQGSLIEITKGRTPLAEERALIRIIRKHPWMIEAFDDITRMMRERNEPV